MGSLNVSLLTLMTLIVFDSSENCESLCTKIFEAVTRLSGLPKEQIHNKMGPVEPFQMEYEGKMQGLYSCIL